MRQLETAPTILILAVTLLFMNTAHAAVTLSSGAHDYLALVKAYANAMIEDGRDTYGTKHSSLFASALDRSTMRIGPFADIPGVRNSDRSLRGANPQVDHDLYAILYRLTEISGEKRYAREADQALRFFFLNCQSPRTGLMTWGEHLFWDFEEEAMGGIDSSHEIKGEWPFWNECYRLAPESCWKFAIGQWDHQIANKQTGDFSRHARWSSHGPQMGADFPRYAGQMIANWSDAYSRKENANRKRRPELVTAISVVVARMETNIKKSRTGYLLAGTDEHHRGISWPKHNLELARCLSKSAPYMKGELAQRMRTLALQMDLQFHRVPHRIHSGGGFVATVDSSSGNPRSRSMNRPYTETWSSGYGYRIHAEMANLCFVRFSQIEKTHPEIAAKYRSLVLSAAHFYLTTTPDTQLLLKPRAIASVITLMLNSHQITEKKEYLERANYFGQLGIKLFLDDGLPLPKATNQHDHYESITGGPRFMLALLKLYEALNENSRTGI